MRRMMLACLSVIAIVATAEAQSRGVRWTRDFNRAVAEAKSTQRPLMLYIHGHSDERLVNEGEIENDQRKAFLNPTVSALSERFIPVEGDFSAQREYLKKWQVSDKTDFEIIFVSPEGEKIDSISSGGVAQPVSLAQKMSACFTRYRNDMFNAKLRKVLEDEKSTPEELKRALKTVTDFDILIADEVLVALLKREKLPEASRTAIVDALTKLSTPNAARYLMEQAQKDPKAAAALAKCLPPVAEQLIDWMEQGDDIQKQYLGYSTAAKIVRAGEVKPETWWKKVNDRVKGDEIKRLSGIIRRVSQNWKQQYGEYR